MIPLSPALLVATANAFVGLGEEGGDNRGQMVELMLREVKQPPGMPWCAAFVHHVGWCSHYDDLIKQSSWPLPDTAACSELGVFASGKGVLRSEPAFGDVFLVYSQKLARFYHTGIVTQVLERFPITGEGKLFTCITIEGNTNDDGSENGYTTLRRRRRFNSFVGDRFIRWPDLDQRQKAA